MRVSAPLRLKGSFDNSEYEDIAVPEVQIDPLDSTTSVAMPIV